MADLNEFERMYQARQQAKSGTLTSHQPVPTIPTLAVAQESAFVQAAIRPLTQEYDYSDPDYRDQISRAREYQSELRRLTSYHRSQIDMAINNIRASNDINALYISLNVLVGMKRRLTFGNDTQGVALKTAIERIYDLDIRAIQNQIDNLRGPSNTINDIFDLPGHTSPKKKAEVYPADLSDTIVKNIDGEKYFDNYPTFSPHKYGVNHELVVTVAKACETIYPGLWDIAKVRPGTFAVIIHFPEFTIRNAAGLSRVLNDLYVKFEIDENTVGPSVQTSLQGRRSTFALDEFQSDYAHSHLGDLCSTGFKSFCMGSDTVLAIGAKMNESRGNYTKSRSKWTIMLEAFLMQISEYVGFENSGGNPYRYLKNIGTQSHSRVNINSTQIDTFLSECRKHAAKLLPFVEYTVDPISGMPSIVQSEEYELELSKNTVIFQCRDRFGDYYDPGSTQASRGTAPDFSNFQALNFRGQPIQFKIKNLTSATNDEPNNRTYYTHRTLKEAFERRLCNILHARILMLSAERVSSERKQISEQLRKSDSTLKTLLKNFKVMSED